MAELPLCSHWNYDLEFAVSIKKKGKWVPAVLVTTLSDPIDLP